MKENTNDDIKPKIGHFLGESQIDIWWIPLYLARFFYNEVQSLSKNNSIFSIKSKNCLSLSS